MQICLSPGRETENLFGVALAILKYEKYKYLVKAHATRSLKEGPFITDYLCWQLIVIVRLYMTHALNIG